MNLKFWKHTIITGKEAKRDSRWPDTERIDRLESPPLNIPEVGSTISVSIG